MSIQRTSLVEYMIISWNENLKNIVCMRISHGFFSFSYALVTCDFQIMAKSVEYRCSFEYLFNAMREIVDAQWHCTFVCLNNIHRWLDFKINIAMRKKGALILNAILAGSIDTHAVPSMHHCFDLFDII